MRNLLECKVLEGAAKKENQGGASARTDIAVGMAEKRCVEAKLTVDKALELELDEVGEEFEQTRRAVAEVDTTSLRISRTSTRREDTSRTHFQTTNMKKSVAFRTMLTPVPQGTTCFFFAEQWQQATPASRWCGRGLVSPRRVLLFSGCAFRSMWARGGLSCAKRRGCPLWEAMWWRRWRWRWWWWFRLSVLGVSRAPFPAQRYCVLLMLRGWLLDAQQTALTACLVLTHVVVVREAWSKRKNENKDGDRKTQMRRTSGTTILRTKPMPRVEFFPPSVC